MLVICHLRRSPLVAPVEGPYGRQREGMFYQTSWQTRWLPTKLAAHSDACGAGKLISAARINKSPLGRAQGPRAAPLEGWLSEAGGRASTKEQVAF